MKCASCDTEAPSITLGTGDEAMTMTSCDRCSRRAWQRRGEVIDLRDVLVHAGGGGRRRLADAAGRQPVGYASAVELMRAGLTTRHVVAALVRELGIDERAARSALAAAQRAQGSFT